MVDTLSANGLQLTLAPGAVSATITLTPVDDTLVESSETVTLALAAGTGYTVGTPSSGSATITDNDVPATLTLATTEASGAEQAAYPMVFTLNRSANTALALVINLTWSGTATFGTDYTVAASVGNLSADGLQLTLAGGVTSVTLTVTPIDDALVDPSETVVLTIASGTNYTLGSHRPVPPRSRTTMCRRH
jgi:hypothetical protein